MPFTPEHWEEIQRTYCTIHKQDKVNEVCIRCRPPLYWEHTRSELLVKYAIPTLLLMLVNSMMVSASHIALFTWAIVCVSFITWNIVVYRFFWKLAERMREKRNARFSIPTATART